MRQPKTQDSPTAADAVAYDLPPSDPGVSAPGMGHWLVQMRPCLFRLAYRLLWNSHDAEEIAQDSLTVALDRMDELREPEKRNTWLYRVAINLSKHRLRGRRRRPTSLTTATTARSDPIGGHIEHDELMQRVRLAMVDLPARQREALVLRDMEQLEYDEIAVVLNTSPATARILVHRGRERMRRILLERWPESFEDLNR